MTSSPVDPQPLPFNRKRLIIIAEILILLIFVPLAAYGVTVHTAQQGIRAWQQNTNAQTDEQKTLRVETQAMIMWRQLEAPANNISDPLHPSVELNPNVSAWGSATIAYRASTTAQQAQQRSNMVTLIKRAQQLGYTCKLSKDGNTPSPLASADVTISTFTHNGYLRVECDWQKTLAETNFTLAPQAKALVVSASYIQRYDNYCPEGYTCTLPNIPNI